MVGSWKWNAGLAAFGFMVTLTLALAHNTWYTSLVRSSMAFILLFLIAYLPRFVLAQAAGSPVEKDEVPRTIETELPGEDDEFQLLTYPKQESEQVTQVVRQWSKEEA